VNSIVRRLNEPPLVHKGATMPDMRYLEARDKFLEYAWDVYSGYFDSKAAFEEQFDWIQEDTSKNLFLKLAAFYKFLVRDGAFRIDQLEEGETADFLDETYKFIAIVAFVEALYSHEKYVDFFEWLSARERRAQVFPVDTPEKLAWLYRAYKADYGATKKTERFFASLDESAQRLIASQITIDGEYKPAEALARLLYGIRSEFVHEARLVLELSSGTMISVRGERVVVSDFSLRDLMKVFEMGLLQHFNFIPYKKG